MVAELDVSFDMYSDTPQGKDPDRYSLTLRRYHKRLWSKPLPSGRNLKLYYGTDGEYLVHRSNGNALSFSSDAITNTYRFTKRVAPLFEKIPHHEIDQFFHATSTIGGYIIFPSKTIDRKPTINGARGLSHKIGDRFDLTLECIRRHYGNAKSPLSATLTRYDEFFRLFEDFPGYVRFFLLDDLVSADCSSVRYWLPFSEFEGSPRPTNVGDYLKYRDAVVDFVSARNERISAYWRSSS